MRYAGGYELRYTRRGRPLYVWKKSMPRIADQFLDSVVYLYPSVEDAEVGRAAGGTGFLINIPSEEHEGYGFAYCVTNSHVVREGEGNSPVIRLNTKDGGTDIIELSNENWVHHQDGDDLAVCPMAMNDPDYFNYYEIPLRLLATKELMERQRIGPGDEVFMVGRFVTHEGRQRNTPVVRFGNISMMPWEPIGHGRGYAVESFLVETRSLSGFSGSPVFVYITPYSARPKGFPEAEQGIWLLGVDWGHLPVHESVKKKEREKWVDVPEGWVVKSNSGQMAVAPAWKLQELIDQEELVVGRKEAEDELTRKKESSPVVLDMFPQNARRSGRSPQEPNEFTEDEFEDAIDRVSRREPPPDQES